MLEWSYQFQSTFFESEATPQSKPESLYVYFYDFIINFGML